MLHTKLALPPQIGVAEMHVATVPFVSLNGRLGGDGTRAVASSGGLTKAAQLREKVYVARRERHGWACENQLATVALALQACAATGISLLLSSSTSNIGAVPNFLKGNVVVGVALEGG